MQNDISPAERARHLRIRKPSPWVERFQHLAPAHLPVLDLASGGGRNARVFLERGHTVTAIDKNTEALVELPHQEKLKVVEFDMETDAPVFGADGPLAGKQFGAVVVVNYLYRPLFSDLIDAVAPGGLFLYDTFARGNEAFSRPRNPDHLLKSGELLEVVSGQMQIVAFEHGRIDSTDIPGVKQRLCAIKDLGLGDREDGDPPHHRIYPD